jgi:hypothetical protein
LAFVRSPTQEPSRIISCLLPARGFPAIFFAAIIGRLESGAARSARRKRPLSWFAWNVSSPVAFVTRQTNGRAVVRNKAEQYRSRARLCLEVARTLSPGKKRLMDRATLIDMAQTWLRLAQEEEQEAANRSDVVGRSGVVQQQQQIQITKKD